MVIVTTVTYHQTHCLYNIRFYLYILFYVILSLSGIFVVLAMIHGYLKWINDIRMSVGLIFICNIIDWYSDIIFAFTVEYCDSRNALFVNSLFVLSVIFLTIPLTCHLSWVLYNQQKWESDKAVGARINGWMRRFRPLLFAITFISGSCFATIKLLNSNFFANTRFRMGLRNKLKDQFDSKRLLIVVALKVEFFIHHRLTIVRCLICCFFVFTTKRTACNSNDLDSGLQ